MTEIMTDRERDEDSGQFRSTVDDEVIIGALRDLGGEGSTRAIADEVELQYRTALNRLQKLKADESAPVTSSRIGNSHLWRVEEEA